jgi:hypothetical protein
MMPMDSGDIVSKLKRINDAKMSMPLGHQREFIGVLTSQLALFLDESTIEACIRISLTTFQEICECGRKKGEHAAHGNWCPDPQMNRMYSETARFRPQQKVEVGA